MPPPGVCTKIINARQKKDGYGSFTKPEKFLNQDFQQLKRYCVIQRVRYIDEMFPPDRKSIGEGLLSPADLARVEWLRPSILVPNPSLVVDGVSRFDFGQGLVGNCWFLAAIGALTFQNDVLEQVVPREQKFDEDYCGLFHFRFWRFGRWVDVVIDDKLPTINGRLIFVRSKDPTEFWPALLEKAYAKVCGSYSDMNAGTPAEAMVDFTGGVHISLHLSDHPPNLWELMCRACQSKSLMGCGTPQGETSANTVLPNGLVQGHAYAVTGVKQMMSRGQPVQLVRLWNPWGKGEWNGDWNDRSPLWQTVSPQDCEMCLSVIDDGEFWMTLEDFCKFYTDLDICCLCPDFLDGSSSCHWKTSFYEGRWVAGTTAGGCMNNLGTSRISGLLKKFLYEQSIFVTCHCPTLVTSKVLMSLFFPLRENSGGLNHEQLEEEDVYRSIPAENGVDDENKRNLFHQFSDKYDEVDAEQLQRLLNDRILKGDLKSGGFSIDACHSMVALMDTSVTGKLNGEEFVRLWRKVAKYKETFFRTDVSQTGTLSLKELRNAITVSELKSVQCILLTVHHCLRQYRSAATDIFRQLSDGMTVTLRESEWMYLSL
ncbi:calpain-3-like [Micropterus dolomieu]|uniref:calpain-3-like n=1 Tax=Micropterus dolomieu TaxID=147949 RepID=UPI001E8E3D85|nr:calpain-3-like [Micropterus dolomieu]